MKFRPMGQGRTVVECRHFSSCSRCPLDGVRQRKATKARRDLIAMGNPNRCETTAMTTWTVEWTTGHSQKASTTADEGESIALGNLFFVSAVSLGITLLFNAFLLWTFISKSIAEAEGHAVSRGLMEPLSPCCGQTLPESTPWLAVSRMQPTERDKSLSEVRRSYKGFLCGSSTWWGTALVVIGALASPETALLLFGEMTPPISSGWMKTWGVITFFLEDVPHLALEILAWIVTRHDAESDSPFFILFAFVTTMFQIVLRFLRWAVIQEANRRASRADKAAVRNRSAGFLRAFSVAISGRPDKVSNDTCRRPCGCDRFVLTLLSTFFFAASGFSCAYLVASSDSTKSLAGQVLGGVWAGILVLRILRQKCLVEAELAKRKELVRTALDFPEAVAFPATVFTFAPQCPVCEPWGTARGLESACTGCMGFLEPFLLLGVSIVTMWAATLATPTSWGLVVIVVDSATILVTAAMPLVFLALLVVGCLECCEKSRAPAG
jgi:hypothetical protein